jgi:putative endonuclease
MLQNAKHNRDLGRFGEILAQRYLLNKGYAIIDKNTRKSYHEIDIIAKIGKITVFIEVKTRTLGTGYSAQDALDKRKINNLKKFRRQAVFGGAFSGEKIRFDFIAIDFDKINKKANIKHFIDII